MTKEGTTTQQDKSPKIEEEIILEIEEVQKQEEEPAQKKSKE